MSHYFGRFISTPCKGKNVISSLIKLIKCRVSSRQLARVKDLDFKLTCRSVQCCVDKRFMALSLQTDVSFRAVQC